MRMRFPQEPLPLDTLNPDAEPWREMRRRMFLIAAPFAVVAAAVGIVFQLPDVNPLDAVMLPLIGVGNLTMAVLTWRRRVRVEMAFSVLYLLLASYFVLMMEEQYRLNVGAWQHLSEASYWFGVVYTLAFLAWNTRRAAITNGVVYGLTLLAALIHLPRFVAAGQLSLTLIAVLAQFYLASGVLTALLTGFAVLKERTEQLRLMAYMDFLTSLPNRRYAEEWLGQAAERNQTLSLAVIDIDHFKRVNDSFGHAVGDLVLREIGQVLARPLRADSRLSRWGGEEFLLMLPDLGKGEAALLCERLRQDIERHHVGEAGFVTASFGLAERRPGEGIASTLRRADEALYAAKRGGRNQVRVADESGDGPPALALPDHLAG